jgi:hypothetical protein
MKHVKIKSCTHKSRALNSNHQVIGNQRTRVTCIAYLSPARQRVADAGMAMCRRYILYTSPMEIKRFSLCWVKQDLL